MLIAYFTTDEVNEWVANRLAADCGVTVCPMFLNAEPAEEGFDALLFDWDFLPAVWREEALTTLTTRPLACPVAVHSYHLSEKQIQALRGNGVQVRRRLQPSLLQALVQVVVQDRPTRRSGAAAPAMTEEHRETPVDAGASCPASSR